MQQRIQLETGRPPPISATDDSFQTERLAEAKAIADENIALVSAVANLDASAAPNVQLATGTAVACGFQDISLSEVIAIALQNSEVLRDLGGTVARRPGNVSSQLDPSLVSSDPRGGVAAALSRFDAELLWSTLWQRNNRGLKQPPFGSNNNEILQFVTNQRAAISKRFRNGSVLQLQQGIDYDHDDLGIPPNRFPSAYTSFTGVELRHPLALGGGRNFNEIAGPDAPPGTFNGIRIARIRADIAADDFQLALRDFVFNTVRAYWLLRFAYTRYEVETRKLEVARRLMEIAERKVAAGTTDPDALDIARERLLATEMAVHNIYYGAPERLLSGILGPNGALLSGTELGLLSLERRLRFLMGMPTSEECLLRPSDSAISAPILFNLHEVIATANVKRPELVRQERIVNQKRLELVAAKNRLQPTLDFVGQARVLGFGDDLLGSRTLAQGSSLAELSRGAQHELSASLEFRWPAGNRIGQTSVHNALLSLARESEIQQQQHLQINHEVTSAVREVARVQRALALSMQRKFVAETRLRNIINEFDQGADVPIEQTLEAQIREIDLNTIVALSEADYQIALASISLARGTLLNDINVHIDDPGSAEGCDAASILSPADSANRKGSANRNALIGEGSLSLKSASEQKPSLPQGSPHGMPFEQGDISVQQEPSVQQIPEPGPVSGGEVLPLSPSVEVARPAKVARATLALPVSR